MGGSCLAGEGCLPLESHSDAATCLAEQLAPIDDPQIGFKELLGIVLLPGTFPKTLKRAAWASFGDNDGNTHAISKGGGHNDVCNVIIAKV